MNFLKELSIKEKVIIHECINENDVVFTITKEDKTCFALQVNWK